MIDTQTKALDDCAAVSVLLGVSEAGEGVEAMGVVASRKGAGVQSGIMTPSALAGISHVYANVNFQPGRY